MQVSSDFVLFCVKLKIVQTNKLVLYYFLVNIAFFEARFLRGKLCGV